MICRGRFSESQEIGEFMYPPSLGRHRCGENEFAGYRAYYEDRLPKIGNVPLREVLSCNLIYAESSG